MHVKYADLDVTGSAGAAVNAPALTGIHQTKVGGNAQLASLR